MSRKGILMVLSGPSGVGKDAVRVEFLKKCAGIDSSVSATSRAMRPGEVDGVDYIFLTREAFRSMIEEGNFLEYTEYNGNFYGTPRPFVEEQLRAGKDVLLKIEVEGALNVKKHFPDAVLVFLVPPSMETLWDRLVGRGTDDRASCENRFRQAYREMACAENYDYIVVNDDLEAAIDDLCSVYRAECCRRERNDALYTQLMTEEVI